VADPTDARPAAGLKRLALLTAGLLAVGMAYLGALLPGLPTTPWVLLAGYCFARSSPRLERWLKRTPYFGRLLTDWERHRGMRRSAKLTATGVIIPVVSLSVLFGGLPVWVRCVIAGLAGVGLCVIWLAVPTVRGDEMPHGG
jgi:uncharacterized membrane protein YbaN (DUF454 family)